MTKKKKTLLLCGVVVALAIVAGLGIWILNANRTVKGNVLDVAWYDEGGTEFTISTADELFELAKLSEYYSFEGQTIKLGADITLNEGDPEDWTMFAPDIRWTPIENFAGTFDGQGHTISGIYGDGTRYTVDLETKKTKALTAGLFRGTKNSCVIKDLRIVNSLFIGDTNQGVGSVTAYGCGTFERIYSSALVITYKQNAGGIIGKLDADGATTIKNCWFDGEMRVEGNGGIFVGGIVGRVFGTKGTNKIEHCLSTGTFFSPVTKRGVNLGGILGNVEGNGKLEVTDSLSLGSVTNEYGVSVGSVVGSIQGVLISKNVYATDDTYTDVIGAVLKEGVGAPVAYPREMLTGAEAYKWTNLDYEKNWVLQEDSTPMLKCFAEKSLSTKNLSKAYDTSWYDNKKLQFEIKTVEEMYGLAVLSAETNFSGQTIKLGADLTVNEGNAADWRENAPEKGWLTIGHSAYPFAGTFDGQMKTISGVYLKTANSYGGLFASTGNTATIKNIKLVNSYFESSSLNFGSVVGSASGRYNNIYSNATIVTTGGRTGGIIGCSRSDSVGVIGENLWFDGSILALGNGLDNRRTGGIVGAMRSNTTLRNCLNTGTVDASAYKTMNNPPSTVIAPCVGGLVGDAMGSAIEVRLENCINTGIVKYSGEANAAYGAAAGYSTGTTTFYNVYVTKESCNSPTGGGKHVGAPIVYPEAKINGMNGYVWTNLDFDKNWAVTEKSAPIVKAFAENAPDVKNTKRMIDTTWYKVQDKVMTIDSVEDFYGFYIMCHNTNFLDKTVRLGKNIIVNKGDAATWGTKAPAYEWDSIGTSKFPFAGTFDGNMKTISGLYQNRDKRFGGIFAYVSEATIKNFIVANSYFNSTNETDGADLAAIVGCANGGTIDTVYVKDTVTVTGAGSRIAGILALSANKLTTINNCWNAGTVINRSKTRTETAGIVARVYENTTVITNCLNTGIIDATAYATMNSYGSLIPNVGGVVGRIWDGSKVTVKSCLSTGEIRQPDFTKLEGGKKTITVGSIVGWGSNDVNAVLATAVYATKESYKETGIRSCITVKTTDILGYKGYQWTDLDFNKYWAVVVSPAENTPILKSFAPTVPSLAGHAKIADTSWYNKNKTEFVLTDMHDLYGLYQLSFSTDFAGKTIKLGNDILVNAGDAATWGTNPPTYEWYPIGTKELPFAGTFDGQGHTISGLYQNRDERFGGIFAYVAEATIRNFIVTNSYFNSTNETDGADLAAVVGCATGGTINTVYVKDTVTVTGTGNRIAGIVALTANKPTKINNCWNAGTVINSSKIYNETAGIVGRIYANTTTITNCLNTGTIDATAYAKQNSYGNLASIVGGLVGQVYENGGKVTLKSCLNVGKIKEPKAPVGKKTLSYGSIIGEGTNDLTAMSASIVYATKESSAQPGFNKCIMVKTEDILGYKGYQWTQLDFDKYWAVVEDGTPVLKSFAGRVADLDGYTQMLDTSWYEQAEGTKNDPYKIADMQDLYGLATLASESTFKGKYIVLTQNITVNTGEATDWKTTKPAYDWNCIGNANSKFAGTFDGQGHTISGIYHKSSDAYVGLFNSLGGTGKIQNLKLANSYFYSTGGSVAAIVGQTDAGSEIHTVYVGSDVIVESSNSRVAGIVALSNGGTISKCWNAARVTATGSESQYIGGILARANWSTITVKDCMNTGTVETKGTNEDPRIGGIVGAVVNGASTTLTVTNVLNLTKPVKTDSNTKSYSAIVGCQGSGTRCTITNAYDASGFVSNPLGTSASKITTCTIASITGDTAKTTLAGFDFGNTWKTVEGNTPVLSAFGTERSSSWYDAGWYGDGTANTFTLNDKEDLYGFAVFAQQYDFKDKTIRLGSDIVINSGKASDWKDTAPTYSWTPIGLNAAGTGTAKKFAGTFDGQGHTISGIYHKSSATYVGLFNSLGGTGKIQNLKLANSYFYSTGGSVAAIVGQTDAGSEIHTVYVGSDVIVESSNSRVAGIVAMSNGGTISKCWNAARVTATGSESQYIGGILARANWSTITVKDCMNTGIVETKGTNEEPRIGGIVGAVVNGASTTLTVTNVLNLTKPIKTDSNTRAYSSIVGCQSSGTTCTITNAYDASGFVSNPLGTSASKITTCTIASITGDTAKTTLAGFDFDNTWKTVEDNTPILKVEYDW